MIRFLARMAMAISLFMTAAAAAAAATVAPVELKPGVPILVRSDAPKAVLLAVADLQRDLEKVLGARSPVIHGLDEAPGVSAIMVLDAGAESSDLHLPAIAGREAHGIHVAAKAGRSHVVLEGSDMRGAIYAIYSFSDEFLGVPPLWFWCDWVPTKQASVSIPGDTAKVFSPPDVRWRAWLNNDTDFLTPWRMRSAANDAAIFETILRLKYNTYEVESIADFSPKASRYAAKPDAAKAHDRGLVLTGHHFSACGGTVRDWERFWKGEGKAVPTLSVNATDALEAFWGYHIEVAKRNGLEMVWTISFRGERDIPFWETFSDAPQDMKARADIINAMLRREVALLKKITGDPAPPLRVTFYNEGTTLLTAGLLNPPAEPTLIWNFVSARRDHFPPEVLFDPNVPHDRQLGYYFNFQFTSTGSHLAAAEGPWKLASNYRTVAKLSPSGLTFTVVNAGNIREHLAELSANADMLWRFANFDGQRFFEKFSARYYGRDVAAEAAQLYRDYYLAYWTQKKPDLPGFERQYLFQDERYARAAEMLLKDMAKGVSRPNPLDGHPLDNADKGSVGYFRVELADGDRDQVDALLRGTTEAGARFAAVYAKAQAMLARVAPQGRDFFQDNLAARAQIMTQVNAMLHELTLAYRAQGKSKDRVDHLQRTVQALGGLKSGLDALSVKQLKGWYAGEHLFGIANLQKLVAEQIAHESS